MFDLGMQELIVIFVVALLVFGPKRLPELAKSMGKAMAQLRSAVSDVKTEVEREIRMSETGLDLEDMPAWKKQHEAPPSQPSGEAEGEGPEPGTGEGGEEAKQGEEDEEAKQGEEDEEAKPQETLPFEHESQDLEEDGRDR
ncbi:MAG: Sec-independent protein translocase protein TatB [Nitrospirota bacterium]